MGQGGQNMKIGHKSVIPLPPSIGQHVAEFVLVEVCWPEENFDQPWNARRQRATIISPELMRDGNCRVR